MIKREVLMDNEWVQLCKMTDDKPPKINGYIYSHEKRCGGNIVAALPHRIVSEVVKDERYNILQFLFRCEATPCWEGKIQVPSSFTGGIDYEMRHLGPDATITKELTEEAGYKILQKDMISLGTCFGTKSSDTVYHLYTINLGEIATNNQALHTESELETTAYCKWVKVLAQKDGVPGNIEFGDFMNIKDFNMRYLLDNLKDPMAAQIILRTLLHYSKEI